MESQIRLLHADEIECRVSTVKESGVSLLLYKDARVDQRVLDETFGLFGWKRSHQCIDGNLYCTVEIRDPESGEWVAKQDVGTVGHAEKEKSQASDSFKRACFNWGIGRELYTAPFIWVPAADAAIKKSGDRLYCSDRFSVRSISYNKNREITGLTVVNDTRNGQPVYELREKPGRAPQPCGALSDAQMRSLEGELRRTGVGMETVQERYNIGNPSDISGELYGKIMAALAKTKSKAA
ncbi:hypothetical protein AALA98_13955 [Lachnospiraceae bacterium 45-W7]